MTDELNRELGGRFLSSAAARARQVSDETRVPFHWFLPESLDAVVGELAGDSEIDRLGRAALHLLVANRVSGCWLEVDALRYTAESPIEFAMGLALLVAGRWESMRVVIRTPENEEFGDMPEVGRYALRIEPQAQLGESRVDFLVMLERSVTGEDGRLRSANKHMAIECQGHDFHEKSKEQVSRDYERSRDLQMVGFLWFPFSGSDIWNDVFMHAQSALGTLVEQVDDQLFPVQGR